MEKGGTFQLNVEYRTRHCGERICDSKTRRIDLDSAGLCGRKKSVKIDPYITSNGRLGERGPAVIREDEVRMR